ncbi:MULTISPECIES: TetR family transcriptional regulator [Micromonospora]|uniref:TetR family transcriptional regulator n=1 Tax=Micromonospora solifontis TaxID=2487138 RepID=A0ABX9W8A0_9ACTN|nr:MULTISPECIES: TetR family transcriptional regulator [Micromonospora]NES12374.1 TetR family transcriptional regulator [Micromonospora sp. PPF5-17B]NES39731.1 TetR family transcriptional regulator [Micromonospora solifontis]NES54143.1 TetR family transcriptional regulator [Micromonospora sp. PPF5-6]RNL86675.1 TetR family transcriptional regulator [Micromonospora solifontis]
MAAVKDGKQTRPYRSAVREESARRTRRAVVRAAGELFTARGYAATSLADVAAAAGVARPTVFAAFGSKAALLRQVLDEALAGDDEPVPVADRPWFRPVWDAPTQGAVLDAYAGVCTLIGARAAVAFETVRRAADEAPEVAELWESLLRNRRAGARMVVERLTSLDGPLRTAPDTERAVDELWFLNDPAHYAALVQRCGWAEESFREWLATRMREALLPG